MNYKAGDTVRIRSKEWIDAQPKNGGGGIEPPEGFHRCFVKDMFVYAWKKAVIARVEGGKEYPQGYRLNIDNGSWIWEDWMFDPGYKGEEALTHTEAMKAMLEGEALYDREGRKYWWDPEGGAVRMLDGESVRFVSLFLPELFYRPPGKERYMTRWEALKWAAGDESLGWMVRYRYYDWRFPRNTLFDDDMSGYRRARILPDRSGVDETTLEPFKVLEEAEE